MKPDRFDNTFNSDVNPREETAFSFESTSPEIKEHAKLPQLKLDAQQAKTFVNLADANGLSSLFFYAHPILRPGFRLQLERRGLWDNNMEPILERIHELNNAIEPDLYEKDALEYSHKLTFRYITEFESQTNADKLVSSALINGGKAPSDTSPGICVDDGYKIGKYLNSKSKQATSLVLFLGLA